MATPTSIPLRLRTPSAPARFLGRAEALARCRPWRDRAHVLLVTGPPGVGKTAFVAALLEREAPHPDAPAPIFIPIAPPSVGGAVQRQVVAALSTVFGAVSPPDHADHDTLVTSVLDLAESAAACVVLDGLERDAERADALVAALARHARRSRWIITSRTVGPTSDGNTRHQLLGPLSTEVMAELAEQSPSSSGLLGEVGGCPRRLFQRVSDAPPQIGGPDDPDMLTGPLATAVGLLAWVGNGVPPQVLPAETPAPELRQAVRRGLILEDADGALSLHPMVATVVRHAVAPPARAAVDDVVRALRRTLAPRALVDALRLTLAVGDLATAEEILDEGGMQILAHGLANALWAALGPRSDLGLRVWRDLAAVDAGAMDSIRLDGLAASSDDSLAVGYAQAKLQATRGERDAAWDLLVGVKREAENRRAAATDAAVQHQMAQLATRCAILMVPVLNNAGRSEEALAAAETIEVVEVSHAYDRAAAYAGTLALLGRSDEARTELRQRWVSLRQSLDDVARPTRSRFAAACYLADVRDHARTLIERQLLDIDSAKLTPAREVVHTAGLIALDDGRLEDLDAFAGQLEAVQNLPHYLDAPSTLLRIGWLCAHGRWDDAEQLGASLASMSRRWWDDQALAGFTASRQIACATAPTERDPVVLDEVMADHLLEEARLWIRWHGAEGATTLPRWTFEKRTTRQMLPARLRAEVLLLRGELEEALQQADWAVAEATRYGYGALVPEMLQLRADIEVSAGLWDAVRTTAAELRSAADTLGARRWALEASWYAAVAPSDSVLDWATLETLGAQQAPAAVAGRRARALAQRPGAEQRLDRVDQGVVQRVRERLGGSDVRLLRGEGDLRWGVDEGRVAAWHAGGEWTQFQPESIAWRVLLALARAGGHLERATLLSTVWDIHRYAPHIHDNRLNVAVYKLRNQLAVEGGGDLVVRAGDGYALAGETLFVPASA